MGFDGYWAALPDTGNNVQEILQAELKIYPNPATGIIRLEIYSGSSTNAKSFYQLRDITGKTLLQGTAIPIAIGTSKFNLDISALSSGVYFINITDGERQIFGKVIKE